MPYDVLFSKPREEFLFISAQKNDPSRKWRRRKIREGAFSFCAFENFFVMKFSLSFSIKKVFYIVSDVAA